MQKPFKRSLAAALVGLATAAAVPQAQAGSNEQFFPHSTYRVGAYASSGIPVWAGMIDYLRYINDVEGGINGVKLVWQECETGMDGREGHRVLRALKKGPQRRPRRALPPQRRAGGCPVGQGRGGQDPPHHPRLRPHPGATDGGVFPYNFPVMLTFYSEASVVINYIAQREGGFEKLKAKKIATVYHHDSAYGAGTQGTLELLAKKYGFGGTSDPGRRPGQPTVGPVAPNARPNPTGCSCAPGACRRRWRSRRRRASASRPTGSSATSG